ncbi:MAG: outer membrane protein transport protein [Halioglobus sp.]|nr:outer membrane protein transport protein [Halioglobus sp.]
MTRTVHACALLAMISASSAVSAGGLWLNEYGDFAGGRAAAGAAAGVDEAMTIAYNPASISALEGSHLFVSAGAIIGDMTFDVGYSEPPNGGTDGGNAGETSPAASLAYVHDIDSDQWHVGVALGGLSGAGFDYGKDWVGRYQATKVSLRIMALSPTIAYRLTDHLSVGVSAQAVYGDLELDFAVPGNLAAVGDGEGSLDGDDITGAFSLGALYELRPGSRFGLFYQSEVDLKFDGDGKVNLAFDRFGEGSEVFRTLATDTELPLAEYVRFSIHQDLDERWGVDLSLGWDNWSALDNVLVSTQDGQSGITTRWRDTWHYAWGVQYKLHDRCDLTGGIAYDSNPVKARDRNAQLPIDRQIRYALGARYHLNDSIRFGGYLNYADLGSANINAQDFGGEFNTNRALSVIINLSWVL